MSAIETAIAELPQHSKNKEQFETSQREMARLADQDPEEAHRVLYGLNLDDGSSSRSYSLAIEALALSSTDLESLLEDEFRRVTQVVESAPTQNKFRALRAFEFMEQSEHYRAAALQLHLSNLDSQVRQVRRAAIKGLHGWNASEEPVVKTHLLRHLDDPCWKVRYEAEWLLKDEDLLPEGYRTPLKDWFWRKITRFHPLSPM